MAHVNWRRLLGLDKRRGHHEEGWGETTRLLTLSRRDNMRSALPSDDVTPVALRLRLLIEECVPCELDEAQITRPHSTVITDRVVRAAREAARDGPLRACVVYCLLVNRRWFRRQALMELWDAELHKLRSCAAEMIAKKIIESEDDTDFLLHDVLLKRFSILVNGRSTPPANVIETAVDLHALRVIGSSGYQKCVQFLWRGWLVQDEEDPSTFVDFDDRDNLSFWAHLDPDRMRAPVYQNAAQILISFIYLGLYTAAVNTINPHARFDVVEAFLYAFTVGFLFDEIAKVWKVGYRILRFWEVFNSVLYGLLLTSLVLRFMALSNPEGSDRREQLAQTSYNFLAFSAPMFWCRLLLYLDTVRFFGVVLVVLRALMTESLVFFMLLVVVFIGFLQAFIGLDIVDDELADDSAFIISAMMNALMQSPDFEGFSRFGHPFGLILYYCFTFIVMVILLNFLIALYNSSYENVYENADDEYLALFAQKTVQFVRAPDENVFIAPFNLVEIFLLILPLEWWLPRRTYARLNDIVMATVYFPLLLCAAFFERRSAVSIRANAARGNAADGSPDACDDASVAEWDQMRAEVDFAADGWVDRVAAVKTNVTVEPAVLEVRKLRDEVAALRDMVAEISNAIASSRKRDAEQRDSTEPSGAKPSGKSGGESGGDSSGGFGGNSSSSDLLQ